MYVTFFSRIPEDCVFFEPPLIARWEFNDKVWKTSDLEEMAYDEGEMITEIIAQAN